MQIEEIFSSIKDEMEAVETRFSEMLYSPYSFISELVKYVTKYKGKRLRPALVIFSGKCAGQVTEHHIDLAVSVELIHTATLIHDDIIDGAQLRRNIPSINSKWGCDISVMLGDFLLSRAFSILASFDSPKALSILLRATDTMCEGELLQLYKRFKFDLTESEYLKIIEQKTAALCATCCKLGAMFANPKGSEVGTYDEDYIQQLTEYGRNLGIAFQIIDDCLDIMGKEREVGKTLHTDLEKGKLTLPIIRLIEVASESEKRRIKELIFSNGRKDKIDSLISLLTTYEALNYTFNRAKDFARQACQTVDNLEDSAPKRSLMSLADYVIQRKR